MTFKEFLKLKHTNASASTYYYHFNKIIKDFNLDLSSLTNKDIELLIKKLNLISITEEKIMEIHIFLP